MTILRKGYGFVYNTLHQQKTCFSVPRNDFLRKIVYNEELGKKDLRVAMLLLAHLEGCKPESKDTRRDMENFQKVNPKKIALELGMSESNVIKSLQHLVNEGILEKGASDVVKNGYRFTI